MSERIRRINKEYNYIPQKRWSWFFVGIPVSLAAAAGIWFFIFHKESGSSQPAAASISDKNLLAAICRDNDCYWVNEAGQAFNQSGRLSGNMILSLADKTSRELKLGDEMIKPETLAELLFLRNRINEETNISLVEGEITSPNLVDFEFVASEGWRLKFSTSENAYKVLETLKQSLAQITKSGPTSLLDYIDLRIPNKVYYKFRDW